MQEPPPMYLLVSFWWVLVLLAAEFSLSYCGEYLERTLCIAIGTFPTYQIAIVFVSHLDVIEDSECAEEKPGSDV
jgi:hypothetical protein